MWFKNKFKVGDIVRCNNEYCRIRRIGGFNFLSIIRHKKIYGYWKFDVRNVDEIMRNYGYEIERFNLADNCELVELKKKIFKSNKNGYC